MIGAGLRVTGALCGGWAILGIIAFISTTEKLGLASGSRRSESASRVGKSSSRGYSSYSSGLARAGISTEILCEAG